MSGNASRYSHQKGRRFSQLIYAPGAMVTDADQREGMAIGLRNTTTLGGTAIRTGVPKTEGIVAWAEVADPSAHKAMTGIRPGKVVADGHVGEVRARSGATLDGGAGIDLLWKQHDLLDAPELADLGGPYACFVDLWHRHVGAAEDPRLVDPGFLSAETSNRTELMAQLKLAALEGGAPADAALRPRVEETLPMHGDFRLTAVAFTSETIEPDVCDPCATVLEDPDQDAGNNLFRLEVHASAFNRADLTDDHAPCLVPGDARVALKWSYDNGSVEVPAAQAMTVLDDSAFDTAVFEITTHAGEQMLGLYTEGMSDRLATLHSRSDVEAALAGAPPDAILRVWDGAVSIDTGVGDLDVQPVGTLSAEGSITTGASWTLEISLGGLALTLEATPSGAAPYILPGDAWCVEVREYATDTGETLIWAPEPVEIEHHYAWVGFIANGAWRNEDQPDMRARAFPALTELDALDVRYDNTLTGAAAWTVHGALDLLFQMPPGEAECDCQCTFTVDPDASLADQLNEIAERIRGEGIERALICFPAGRFALEEPVAFSDAAAITLRGAGRDLTVIDVLRAVENTGIISFFTVETVNLEEFSIVGNLNVDGEIWGLGIHDVSAFSAWRVSMRITVHEGARMQAMRLMSDRGNDVPARVTVRECVFRIGGNTQALLIWRAASTLLVQDNEFRAIEIETFGAGHVLNASNDFVLNTNVVPRTPARERQIGDGFFMPYPGNSELLLDFTGIAPAAREAAGRYWTVTLRMLNDQGEIAAAEDFADVRRAVSTLNAAARIVVEAEAAELFRSPAGRRDDDAIVEDFPVIGALTRGRGGVSSGFIGATTARTGRIANTGAILVAGGSRPGDTGRGDSTADLAALRLIEVANGHLTSGGTVASFVGAIAPFLRLPESSDRAHGLPNWGVFAYTRMPIEAAIAGNRFLDLDVAIDLVARPSDSMRLRFAPPVPATIRDNTVLRRVRTDRVIPDVSGEEPNPAGEGLHIGRHPIFVFGYSDMTIENNAITQIKPDDMSAEEFEERFFGSQLPDGMSSFSAISVHGVVGPKLRAIGNAAFAMRHCVYVNAEPVRRANFDMADDNVWIFRENSALPVFLIDRDIPSPAVVLGPAALGGGHPHPRRIFGDNHPINSDFETL
jgi:hypothetical protein